MNSCPLKCSDQDRERIRRRAMELGAYRAGFAAAEPVSDEAWDAYSRWIAQGRHATMDYCERYGEVRRDPRLLLDGAATVISCAFAYPRPRQRGLVSAYAQGLDYHHVVKGALMQLGASIEQELGGATRAVVDTAPMMERYWAVKAGVGFTGLNRQLIVPGAGSCFFLGELLWTGAVCPDEPCRLSCGECRACIEACPGHALDPQEGLDARRCVSYLTIEHRGELPDGARLGGCVYGCDACLLACPHNRGPEPASLPQFAPRPEIATLTAADIMAMTPSHYKKLVAHSAMRRAPLPQILRNLKQTGDRTLFAIGDGC